MAYEPTTNFKDSNNVDLGKKLVPKEYLLEVYGSILESLGNSGLTVSPSLWVWGAGYNGRLATNGHYPGTVTPVTTFAGGTNWKQISAGSEFGGGIKTDGTLWTWGNCGNGRLGNNVTSCGVGILTPVTTFAGGNDWKQISCNGSNTMAIKNDGSLWVWGNDEFGVSLGTNGGGSRPTPVTTFAGGNDWKQVSNSGNGGAAIKTDGSLWVWGVNNFGGLGTNDTTSRPTPVTTFAGGNDWKQASHIGFSGIRAIKTDGSLWVWGFNSSAWLGNYTGNLPINSGGTDRLTPVTTFAGGNDWKFVAGQGAIKTDGSLWVWGLNGDGSLGTNDTVTKSTPVTTFAGGNNWKFFAGKAAIKTDGSLWVWGNPGQGSLGINATGTRSTPVTTFAGGNNWKQVSVSGDTMYAIRSVDYI